MPQRLRAYLRELFDLPAFDRETIGTALGFVLIALCLLTLERFGLQEAFYTYFDGSPLLEEYDEGVVDFLSQIHFSVAALLLFVLVPTLFHFVFPVGEPGLFGLGLGHLRPHLKVYAVLPAVMVPVVWFASAQPAFYNFYPMYNPPSLRLWILYEFVYFFQFFAVEFFFRGLLLFRLERRFGLMAVWIMLVPYALLHIHKPFPEAVGSIVAGLILGTLSLRSRSIWAGVAVHCTVAFAADLFALIRSGRWELLGF